MKQRERFMGKHHKNKKEENINVDVTSGDKINISAEATEALKKESESSVEQEQKIKEEIKVETSKSEGTENIDIKNKLENEKKELEDEVAKWKNEYLRKMADFENYRKRMIKEKKRCH